MDAIGWEILKPSIHLIECIREEKERGNEDNIGSRAACICRDSFSIEMERGRREWLIYKDQQYTYYTEGLKDLFIFIRLVISRLPLFNIHLSIISFVNPQIIIMYTFFSSTYKEKVPKLSCEKSNFQQIYTYRPGSFCIFFAWSVLGKTSLAGRSPRNSHSSLSSTRWMTSFFLSFFLLLLIMNLSCWHTHNIIYTPFFLHSYRARSRWNIKKKEEKHPSSAFFFSLAKPRHTFHYFDFLYIFLLFWLKRKADWLLPSNAPAERDV